MGVIEVIFFEKTALSTSFLSFSQKIAKFHFFPLFYYIRYEANFKIDFLKNG